VRARAAGKAARDAVRKSSAISSTAPWHPPCEEAFERRNGLETKGTIMTSTIATRSIRLATLAAVGFTLAGLTGCSSGINTMTAPTTATRMGHSGAYPIDDPSPRAADSRMPPVVGRGYGYMGG
jgi:hypothetical protein